MGPVTFGEAEVGDREFVLAAEAVEVESAVVHDYVRGAVLRGEAQGRGGARRSARALVRVLGNGDASRVRILAR